ncbi:SAV_915 family protein [Streptomyces sp. FIT100]|uniref:SAV_915 family protein n=1 Tax=Streptomyces sp. FIT100 TaxID=2837956 RepID=UPI0021CA5D3A|nr:SAV_915 family protein [Streptomyces sp. FIT100]
MDELLAEDTDPDEPRPAAPLFVPVRLGSAGGHQLRFMRTPLGVRTAVGFTSARRLTAVLGAGQAWTRLAEPALRALSEPLGVTVVTVDPQLTAHAPSRVPGPAPAPAPGPARVPGPAPAPAPAAARIPRQAGMCARRFAPSPESGVVHALRDGGPHRRSPEE